MIMSYYFLAAPIYWLLDLINSSIGNFGISIILLTVVVKGLFYKLSETQYRVLIGPFNDIKTLKNSFEKMNFFEFENLEILKNA